MELWKLGLFLKEQQKWSSDKRIKIRNMIITEITIFKTLQITFEELFKT